MGSVAAVITMLFLLLGALDRPFHEGVGGLKPTAMERSLTIVDQALAATDARITAPVRRRRERDRPVSGGGILRAERIEVLATVLLALATVGTAWSGYQASRWNGEQAKAFARASALRIDSTKADSLANAQTQVDVATFTQWVDAYAQRQTRLADFYFRRFRPEFKPAVAPGSRRGRSRTRTRR